MRQTIIHYLFNFFWETAFENIFEWPCKTCDLDSFCWYNFASFSMSRQNTCVYLTVTMPNVLSLSSRFLIMATVLGWNSWSGRVCPGTKTTPGRDRSGSSRLESSSSTVRPLTSSRSFPRYCNGIHSQMFDTHRSPFQGLNAEAQFLGQSKSCSSPDKNRLSILCHNQKAFLKIWNCEFVQRFFSQPKGLYSWHWRTFETHWMRPRQRGVECYSVSHSLCILRLLLLRLVLTRVHLRASVFILFCLSVIVHLPWVFVSIWGKHTKLQINTNLVFDLKCFVAENGERRVGLTTIEDWAKWIQIRVRVNHPTLWFYLLNSWYCWQLLTQI